MQSKEQAGNRQWGGKSFVGLLVASLVAGVFTVIWLVIAALTEREFGILAWGIGGAVGFVAGAIAKNQSPTFCGLVAGIAVSSVVMAKLVMALLIMVVGNFSAHIKEAAEAEFRTHVVADQLLADGVFDKEPKQKAYVERMTKSYFNSTLDDLGDEGEEEEAVFDAIEAVDARIAEEASKKTPADLELLKAAAKKRHPQWEIPNFKELEAELGDGSFLSSLREVVSFFDIIWVLLGATTAYSAAKKQAAAA